MDMTVNKFLKSRWLLIALPLVILSSLGLGWVSSGYSGIQGWFSFLAVFLLMGGVVGLAWLSIQQDNPAKWLLTITILAAVLRLTLGVFWFLALPEWGYENEVQQAGYVMRDPFERDTDAWELAQSDRSLNVAFQGTAYDQYGGLLYLSAFVYRVLGAETHQPLLIIVVTATFSALAVIYVWAFAYRQWGEKVAALSAWFMVLYPEAMLLGSAQMREAFTVTLAVAGVYFLHRFWHARTWYTAAVIGALILVSAAISFPFAGWLFLLFVLLSLVMGKEVNHSWKPSWTVIVLFLLIFAAGVFYWTNRSWIAQAGYYQWYITWRSSGHLQALFRSMPEWLQAPFVVVYGVFRPLLPAALIARSEALLWQVVAIWRSLGWTILLVTLIYASILSLRKGNWYKTPGALLLMSWIFTFIASYRGGGDDWDNPRYRVAITGIQVALAAWALVTQREEKDPWLRRIIGMTLAVVFWVLLWYIPRYFSVPWSVGKPLDAIGLGLVSSVLYLIWDLCQD
jgi:hypothetical protein